MQDSRLLQARPAIALHRLSATKRGFVSTFSGQPNAAVARLKLRVKKEDPRICVLGSYKVFGVLFPQTACLRKH